VRVLTACAERSSVIAVGVRSSARVRARTRVACA
jgi:hypothetical protein